MVGTKGHVSHVLSIFLVINVEKQSMWRHVTTGPRFSWRFFGTRWNKTMDWNQIIPGTANFDHYNYPFKWPAWRKGFERFREFLRILREKEHRELSNLLIYPIDSYWFIDISYWYILLIHRYILLIHRYIILIHNIHIDFHGDFHTNVSSQASKQGASAFFWRHFLLQPPGNVGNAVLRWPKVTHPGKVWPQEPRCSLNDPVISRYI